MMILRRLCIRVVLLSLSCCCLLVIVCDAAGGKNNNNSSNINPYSILGVSKDATQDEITKKYRQSCLKYHPDKNVNLSQEEQTQCEDTFKNIQEAYSLVGTKEDRKNYDTMSRLQQRYGNSGGYGNNGGYGNSGGRYGPGSSDPLERAFQQFFEQGGSSNVNLGRGYGPYGRYGRYGRYGSMPRQRRRAAFYVNGVDVSHLFDPANGGGLGGFFGGGNHNGPGGASDVAGVNYPKSIFVQHVTVPLQDLYSGTKRGSRGKELYIDDNIIQRYRAAFRGGIATQLIIQGLMTSIPLFLRSNRPIVSILCFLATFHISLPHPSRHLSYNTKIQPGWKGGTKLKYSNVEPGMDLVFVLKEGKHERFKRVGNDLVTEITIGRTKARDGCTIFIEPLDESGTEMPIMVKLKPGEIDMDDTKQKQKQRRKKKIQRHLVTVSNRGWPYRNGSSDKKKGDLRIVISVVSDSKADKLEGNNGSTSSSTWSTSSTSTRRRKSGRKKKAKKSR